MGIAITWSPSDSNPHSFTLYLNGTEIATDEWNGSSIEVSVDGFTLGYHNFTLVVVDGNGLSANDTVIVRVVDTTHPVIDNPINIEYELGSVGNLISWNPSDLFPESYSLLRNGTELLSEDWDGLSLEISVDGLSPGHYNYTLIVFDTSGNNVSDSVIVNVIDTTSPTINHPTDLTCEAGSLSNFIAWEVFDYDPSHYEIYRNGTLLQSVIWDGSQIAVNDVQTGNRSLDERRQGRAR